MASDKPTTSAIAATTTTPPSKNVGQKTAAILSFDGGGSRGVMELVVLDAVYRMLTIIMKKPEAMRRYKHNSERKRVKVENGRKKKRNGFLHQLISNKEILTYRFSQLFHSTHITHINLLTWFILCFDRFFLNHLSINEE